MTFWLWRLSAWMSGYTATTQARQPRNPLSRAIRSSVSPLPPFSHEAATAGSRGSASWLRVSLSLPGAHPTNDRAGRSYLCRRWFGDVELRCQKKAPVGEFGGLVSSRSDERLHTHAVTRHPQGCYSTPPQPRHSLNWARRGTSLSRAVSHDVPPPPDWASSLSHISR
jgi:hypothetical protein